MIAASLSSCFFLCALIRSLRREIPLQSFEGVVASSSDASSPLPCCSALASWSRARPGRRASSGASSRLSWRSSSVWLARTAASTRRRVLSCPALGAAGGDLSARGCAGAGNGCCSTPTGVCTRWSPQNAGLPGVAPYVERRRASGCKTLASDSLTGVVGGGGAVLLRRRRVL